MTTEKPTRRWLLLALVVGCILISVAEVWLLTVVGRAIGLVPTVILLLVEAIAGAILTRHEGRKSWSALVAAYRAGRMPTGQLADAALVLVGGIMLILPGFLTDIAGLMFLLPPTRRLVRTALGWAVATQVAKSGFRSTQANPSPGTVPGTVVNDQPEPPRRGPIVLHGEIENDSAAEE